jgi:hypothetical protein
MTPTLPPIPWQPLPITPLPEVFIDDTPTGWALWDASIRVLDVLIAARKRDERIAKEGV